jgi:hypothetical protein
MRALFPFAGGAHALGMLIVKQRPGWSLIAAPMAPN